MRLLRAAGGVRGEEAARSLRCLEKTRYGEGWGLTVAVSGRLS